MMENFREDHLSNKSYNQLPDLPVIFVGLVGGLVPFFFAGKGSFILFSVYNFMVR